jgi:hypothetical protein
VVKVARQYYHLQFIASTGAKPYIDKRTKIFRKKFKTVEYWSFYRLWWNCGFARKDCFGKRIKRMFSSQSEYEDYIKESEGNCKNPIDDINEKSSNNIKINKGEKIMERSFNVVEWLKQQESITGEVFIYGGGYAKMSKGRDPSPIQICNFALKAEAMITQGSQWWFECIIVNSTGIIRDGFILSRDDLQSAAAFKKALAGDSCLQYYGDAKDTTRIQGILTSQNPPKKYGTDKIGIHKVNGKWVYVEGENVVGNNGTVNDIVFTKKTLKQDDMPALLQQSDITDADLKSIACNLNKFNEPNVVYPLLGWTGFCFVKERLAHKVNGRNPILLCQGEPGSGKTETVSRIMLPIFCNQKPISNIADMTKFGMSVNASKSNFIPCVYDEWKYSVMDKSRIKDLDSMLLASFNQTNLCRGTADQTVNEYRFTSPTVILGEMTLDSASIKHRMIELFFNYKGRNGRETYFRNLCQLPLGSFGKGLLLHSLSISDERLNGVFDEQRKLVDSSLDDRFAENAALARVGLWLIIDYLNANGIATDDYAEGYDCIDNVIKESLAAARITNVDKIIVDLSVMSHTRNCSGNWLNNGYHYEIRDGKLYVRIAEAYDSYRRYAKTNDVTSEIINKSSFLQQLQTKPYYENKKTYRIGGVPCNAVCINLSAIPTYMEVKFAA